MVDIEIRLERIEQLLETLLDKHTVRDFYTVEQLAERVGLAPFTVREHCRLGRLNAQKKELGRGAHASCVISHEELVRYQRFGLLKIGDKHNMKRNLSYVRHISILANAVKYKEDLTS